MPLTQGDNSNTALWNLFTPNSLRNATVAFQAQCNSNEIPPHWLKSYPCLKKTPNVAYTCIWFYLLIHAAYYSVQMHVWPLLNPINEEQKWWLGSDNILCFFVEGLCFIRLKICRFFAALCILNVDVISIMWDSAERNGHHQIISTSVSG